MEWPTGVGYQQQWYCMMTSWHGNAFRFTTKYLDAVGGIGDEQAGFRHDYSTTDHIFTLHAIIDMYIKNGKKLYIAFIDYRKAFDFIDRVSLWDKMIATGINGKILQVIYNLYHNAKSCVRSNGKMSDYFSCDVGVRQGENLSPLLFSIFLNDFELYISRHYDGLKTMAGDVNLFLSDEDTEHFLKIFVLLYADDTIVLAETADELQKALNAVYDYCEMWQLTVNTEKTKVVIFSRAKVQNFPAFVYGHKHIEVVDDYVYLGCTFNYNGNFHKAIAKQVSQAKKAYYSLMKKIIKFKLPVDIALQLFDQLVLPVLLYGSEVWCFTKIDQIEIFYRKCLKELLGVSMCTTNVMVYGETGTMPVLKKMISRAVNYFTFLCNGKHSKLSYIMYKVMRCKQESVQLYQAEWLKFIERNLSNMGMRSIWMYEGFGFSNTYVKEAMKLRLKDMYIQEWNAELNMKKTCGMYKLMKATDGIENYLIQLPYQQRRSISRFRCRNNKLPITHGRDVEIDVDEMFCPYCDYDVLGDEFHYLFVCEYFSQERNMYIDEKWTISPQLHFIHDVFQGNDSRDLRNLALFIDIIVEAFSDAELQLQTLGFQ